MNLFLPLLIFFCGCLFLFRGKRCTAAFLRGAKDGLSSAAALFPTLLLFVCAVSLFRASGAVSLLSTFLAPVCDALHIPPALIPLLVTRPVSGSASTAVLSDLFDVYGADSAIGLYASVIAGSSETMLYVLSIYCAGTSFRHIRRAAGAAALTTLFITAVSLVVSNLLFTP